MSLQPIQTQVDDWTAHFDPQYWPPYEILARLIEEVGELGRELNHLYGNKKKKASETENELASEIIDVLFTLVCLANSHDIDLQAEWDKMVRLKMQGRDQTRFTPKK